MLGMKKKQESEEANHEESNENKIKQLEAKEIEIEEEIEKIKEVPKESPVVEKKEEVLDEDFEDEYDDEDDSPLEYRRTNKKAEEHQTGEEMEEITPQEKPQEQLNNFLLELDARIGRVESILFRLTQNGKQ